VSESVIRVGIVDDHPLTREGLIQLLESADDVVVVGEASDGGEALDLVEAEEGEPDIILLDVRMPDIDGVEVARRIIEHHPSVGIIMLSAYDDRAYVAEAMKAGARGYVLKSAEPERLIDTVRLVARGHMVIDQELAGALTEGTPEGRERLRPTDPFSAREIEILQLLSFGLTNRDIADRLGISMGTVGRHVEHILLKLGVSDRTAAAVEALRRNLIA